MNSTGSSWSARRRCSSLRVRPGMMQSTGSATGDARLAVCTAKRNPSAAAKVTLSPSISSFTPVSTGRESSVAAANTILSIASLSTLASIATPTPSSTVGMGGNSSASVPRILPSKRPEVSSIPRGFGVCLTSIWSSGRETTKSVRRRAGTVTDPSSSTLPPIQVVMAISRLVAVSLMRPSSVVMRTFCVTGSVLRVATARPTVLRALLRFSCKQVKCML